MANVIPTGAQGGAPSSPPAGDTANRGPIVSQPSHYDGYAWLLAWGVMIAVLTFLNGTRVGHTVIYYTLVLLLFFILVSNYRFIATALAPFQSLPAQG